MALVRISAPWTTSLSHFMGDPGAVLQVGASAAVAVLHENEPLFYVLTPQAWSELHQSEGGFARVLPIQAPEAPPKVVVSEYDRFERLAEELLRAETTGVPRPIASSGGKPKPS